MRRLSVWSGVRRVGVVGVVTAAALVGAGLAVPLGSVAAAAVAVADQGPAEAPDVHRAQLLAAKQDRTILVTGESTETSKTWVNPDGTLSTSSWVAPVQARRADGTWAPIDTTLVSDAAGVHPANTTVAMTFGGAGWSGAQRFAAYIRIWFHT